MKLIFVYGISRLGNEGIIQI